MKLYNIFRLLPLLFFALVLNARPAEAADAGWNVAVLDQLLASVPKGAATVQVGDMMIPVSYLQSWRNKLAGGRQPNVAFNGTFTAWPGGNVYYSFSNNVSTVKQRAFLDGMAEWAMFANLHFIPRTSQANYVTIYEAAALEGGQSMVGMVGGQQFLLIGPIAWNRPTITHELGHTLGLVHEQQRSDRGSFVTILTNNIIPGDEGNFVILTDSQNKSAYDFLSIMHYSRNALSVSTSLDTIAPLPAYARFLNVMGQQYDPVLSASDRAGMAAVYGAGPAITNIVTNTLDSGPGSLRAALYYAFDHPGTTISFNIPVSDAGFSNSVFNIQPSDALPSLWGNTTLDATTEPTNSNPAGPGILLNGSLGWPLSVYPNGLRFRGTNSVARGFVINNFPGFGVLMDGSNTVGNTVSGCYLGIDPTGTSAVSNGVCSAQISGGAISNLVGGTTAAARNVIGGSFYQGLVIRDAGTRFNSVQGNYIGVNAAGTAALPNTWEGIEIFGGAQSNFIGGYTVSARNVISGNNYQGIGIADPGTSGNIVAGNYIGVNPADTAALPNGWSGVDVFNAASANVVGPSNVISGNLNYGVVISSTGAVNVVQANFIGLNAGGTAAMANGWAGVGIFSGAQSNLVGGSAAPSRNVISGNSYQGVVIGNSGTSGNIVAGNYVGLNAAGTAAVPNGWAGAEFFGGAQGNLFGGSVAAARNVISGNTGQGVAIDGTGTSGNQVQGNYIGVNPAGTAAIGNGWAGVNFFGGATANLVGGSVPGAGNVISGNHSQGVLLQDAGTSGNLVQGNLIGLNAAGDAAISNTWAGVEIYNGPSANLIGGYGGARNFISGNGLEGVRLDGPGTTGNLIQGNTIGLDAANLLPVPNFYSGVVLFGGATGNQIGGLTLGAANLMSANPSGGVVLYDAATTNNTVRGNSIFNNNGIGIALYNSANQNLAAPALASAVVTTNTVVSGTYSGAAGKNYQLDFYADAATEAMTYLGSISVTGTGGVAAFNASLGARLPAGRMLTATATDPAGNTSPLSAGIAATMTSTPNDGIPDAWRAKYFGGSGTTTNSQSAWFADPDYDGMSNLQEFLAGTNPTNAASVLKLTVLNPNTSTNVVGLNSSSGTVYRVFSRDDLISGNWAILADQVLGTGTNIFFFDPASPTLPKRFYRAQVLW